MNDYLPVEGAIKEGDIYSLLYNIYKNSISGHLIVTSGDLEKTVIIENRKIVFASSNSIDDSLGNYLLNQKVIEKDIYDRISEYIVKHRKRFGRALIELGYLNYDQLWKWVQKHLQMIVFSLFDIKQGEYRILINPEQDIENIVLDLDMLVVIVEGMRGFRCEDFFHRKFAGVKNLYASNTRIIHRLDLKPYEIHIYDLVKRQASFENVLKASELLRFDTLRILYLFLLLEIISTEKKNLHPPPKEEDQEENGVGKSAFKSFEEALKFYNMKYEMVYKVLSKEIGPIAFSIFSRAVEDIMDNLPHYFRRIKLTPNGSINKEFLKSVWYHDFDKYAGGFLRGLEEILYAEVYMVKKHLGVDQEQQVLKWLMRTGS
ncbi:MAG: DUF4388 domain-containing protein [Candidatus Aminicenantes bacterium]|nr:DUF4388 domain-containing protein [Candidatus Aminicenantes bacterium]